MARATRAIRRCTERRHAWRGRGTALVGLGLSAGLALAACSVDSAKSRYILAERFFADGKHAAAVVEFDRVVAKDPRGKLGLQALYRSAMTQTLYLSQHSEALRKFRLYAEASGSAPSAWEAELQIGEILYARTERYDQAIQHYRRLLKERAQAEEAPLFLYRIAKGQFFLHQFAESVASFRELIARHPQAPEAERAAYEVGLALYTRGEQSVGGQGPGMAVYKDAITAYQEFLARHPTSRWAPEAKFGIAACLEELDQLDAAYQQFQSLLNSYPSPNVIKIKLARIRERQTQRSR